LGELLKLGVLAYVHTNPALMALEVLGSESDAEKKRAEQRQSESHTLQSLRQRLDDSWYRLERVAMNYGVEPKR
jgi:hypothetical protein